ncbi:hypothetical protein ACJIZ3_012964 [Penstemon smallii]|uniref:Uncharacterized protein n=1 Tax=Penstemon smallii TaxID=265156 RepID=A0ABD3UPM4_9LAMI
MAETKNSHIVEIPIDEEHQQKLLSAMTTAIQHHPLAEISQSPGHFLLLKLWQRQEHFFGRRISRKESKMDSIGRELFQLCCFFFIFHGLFFTILFTSSSRDHHHCHKWWIPSLLSACTSLAIVFLVQVKLWMYWKVDRQLQGERNEGRALARCIQELRMKGASFDLCKEPQNGKRMKSSSVEIKWKPVTWCLQYRVTLDICSYHLRHMQKVLGITYDIYEQVLTGSCDIFTSMIEAYCSNRPSNKDKGKKDGRDETYSSLGNVRTQSISFISQRLTKESALPTAKYLSNHINKKVSATSP